MEIVKHSSEEVYTIKCRHFPAWEDEKGDPNQILKMSVQVIAVVVDIEQRKKVSQTQSSQRNVKGNGNV